MHSTTTAAVADGDLILLSAPLQHNAVVRGSNTTPSFFINNTNLRPFILLEGDSTQTSVLGMAVSRRVTNSSSTRTFATQCSGVAIPSASASHYYNRSLNPFPLGIPLQLSFNATPKPMLRPAIMAELVQAALLTDWSNFSFAIKLASTTEQRTNTHSEFFLRSLSCVSDPAAMQVGPSCWHK